MSSKDDINDGEGKEGTRREERDTLVEEGVEARRWEETRPTAQPD